MSSQFIRNFATRVNFNVFRYGKTVKWNFSAPQICFNKLMRASYIFNLWTPLILRQLGVYPLHINFRIETMESKITFIGFRRRYSQTFSRFRSGADGTNSSLSDFRNNTLSYNQTFPLALPASKFFSADIVDFYENRIRSYLKVKDLYKLPKVEAALNNLNKNNWHPILNASRNNSLIYSKWQLHFLQSYNLISSLLASSTWKDEELDDDGDELISSNVIPINQGASVAANAYFQIKDNLISELFNYFCNNLIKFDNPNQLDLFDLNTIFLYEMFKVSRFNAKNYDIKKFCNLGIKSKNTELRFWDKLKKKAAVGGLSNVNGINELMKNEVHFSKRLIHFFNLFLLAQKNTLKTDKHFNNLKFNKNYKSFLIFKKTAASIFKGSIFLDFITHFENNLNISNFFSNIFFLESLIKKIFFSKDSLILNDGLPHLEFSPTAADKFSNYFFSIFTTRLFFFHSLNRFSSIFNRSRVSEILTKIIAPHFFLIASSPLLSIYQNDFIVKKYSYNVFSNDLTSFIFFFNAVIKIFKKKIITFLINVVNSTKYKSKFLIQKLVFSALLNKLLITANTLFFSHFYVIKKIFSLITGKMSFIFTSKYTFLFEFLMHLYSLTGKSNSKFNFNFDQKVESIGSFYDKQLNEKIISKSRLSLDRHYEKNIAIIHKSPIHVYFSFFNSALKSYFLNARTGSNLFVNEALLGDLNELFSVLGTGILDWSYFNELISDSFKYSYGFYDLSLKLINEIRPFTRDKEICDDAKHALSISANPSGEPSRLMLSNFKDRELDYGDFYVNNFVNFFNDYYYIKELYVILYKQDYISYSLKLKTKYTDIEQRALDVFADLFFISTFSNSCKQYKINISGFSFIFKNLFCKLDSIIKFINKLCAVLFKHKKVFEHIDSFVESNPKRAYDYLFSNEVIQEDLDESRAHPDYKSYLSNFFNKIFFYFISFYNEFNSFISFIERFTYSCLKNSYFKSDNYFFIKFKSIFNYKNYYNINLNNHNIFFNLLSNSSRLLSRSFCNPFISEMYYLNYFSIKNSYLNLFEYSAKKNSPLLNFLLRVKKNKKIFSPKVKKNFLLVLKNFNLFNMGLSDVLKKDGDFMINKVPFFFNFSYLLSSPHLQRKLDSIISKEFTEFTLPNNTRYLASFNNIKENTIVRDESFFFLKKFIFNNFIFSNSFYKKKLMKVKFINSYFLMLFLIHNRPVNNIKIFTTHLEAVINKFREPELVDWLPKDSVRTNPKYMSSHAKVLTELSHVFSSIFKINIFVEYYPLPIFFTSSAELAVLGENIASIFHETRKLDADAKKWYAEYLYVAYASLVTKTTAGIVDYMVSILPHYRKWSQCLLLFLSALYRINCDALGIKHIQLTMRGRIGGFERAYAKTWIWPSNQQLAMRRYTCTGSYTMRECLSRRNGGIVSIHLWIIY